MASQGGGGGAAPPARGPWEDDNEPRMPEGCVPVEEVDGLDYHSYKEFKDALSEPNQESVNRPIILRKARLKMRTPFNDFKVRKIDKELGNHKLPGKSERGAGFFVGDQGNRQVMDDETVSWHPRHCFFKFLTERILSGSSSLYMRMSSANGACMRSNTKHEVITLAESECTENIGPLLKEFVDRAPFPTIIPFGQPFAMVFWMGSEGKSFGLHSDLFTEQYFVQNEGVKEVFLMLPEDSTLVAPFSFLTSEKYYKSSHRTVRAMDLSRTGCLWALLRPGDVLYIPPMWWHEFRIVSKGPSLSTTVRRHLNQEEKNFLGIVKNFRALHERLEARGSDRLARHVISYFFQGMCLGLPAAQKGYYAGVLQNLFASCRAVEGDQPGDGGELVDAKDPSDDGGSSMSTRHPSGEAPSLGSVSEDMPATPPELAAPCQPADGASASFDQWKVPAIEAWCKALEALRSMFLEDVSGGPFCKLAAPKEQRALAAPQKFDAAADSQGTGANRLGAACDLPLGAVLAGLLAATSGGFVMGVCIGRRMPR